MLFHRTAEESRRSRPFTLLNGSDDVIRMEALDTLSAPSDVSAHWAMFYRQSARVFGIAQYCNLPSGRFPL